MKKLLLIFCVSVLVLSIAGFAAAQQRGYQGGRTGQFESQNQPQQGQSGQDQQGQYGRQQDQQAFGRDARQQMAGNFYRASDLIDKKIKNQQGEDLGQVSDLIITRNGQVAYMIVARGGVLGVGDKYIPVPFRNAQFDPQQDALVLPNVDKQMLANAPTISKDDWQRLEDPGFERQVFSYYGQQQWGTQQQPQQRPMQQQRSGQQSGRY